MHSYRKVEGGWEVGYHYVGYEVFSGVGYDPRGPCGHVCHKWHAVRTVRSEDTAARYCNYLNGGVGDKFHSYAFFGG